jgi:hypothetical protein
LGLAIDKDVIPANELFTPRQEEITGRIKGNAQKARSEMLYGDS